jgi:toxin-antitoxin system PIN domain toxin
LRLVDLNLLLYAVNSDSPRHAAAKEWVEETIGDVETVAIPWVVILGFLRLSTSRHVFARPLRPEEAVRVVESWLGRPNVVALSPGRDHWRVMKALVMRSGTAGNLTTDAHLAALAIEHGCQLCSTDADFGRFPQLDWINPLLEEAG